MLRIFLTMAILIAMPVAQASAEDIRVEGGGAAISAAFEPIKEIYEKTTGNTLTAVMTSPVKGLVALDKGTIDMAVCAYPFNELLAMAANDGVTVDQTSFWSTIIGNNRLVVFTHKKNRVEKLSRSQLKDIFTGKTTNWKQVGGENMPIAVVWGTKTPGQNALFNKYVLENAPITNKNIQATDYKNIRDIVSANPGAIGIDPIGFKSSDVHSPQTPLITSPLTVVTKGAPSEKVLKVLDFYKNNIGFME